MPEAPKVPRPSVSLATGFGGLRESWVRRDRDTSRSPPRLDTRRDLPLSVTQQEYADQTNRRGESRPRAIGKYLRTAMSPRVTDPVMSHRGLGGPLAHQSGLSGCWQWQVEGSSPTKPPQLPPMPAESSLASSSESASKAPAAATEQHLGSAIHPQQERQSLDSSVTHRPERPLAAGPADAFARIEEGRPLLGSAPSSSSETWNASASTSSGRVAIKPL